VTQQLHRLFQLNLAAEVPVTIMVGLVKCFFELGHRLGVFTVNRSVEGYNGAITGPSAHPTHSRGATDR
jgi:hypothetical protein